MTPRALVRLLGAYAALVLLLAVFVYERARLRAIAGEEQTIVESDWQGGRCVARWTRLARERAPERPKRAGVTVVDERVVAEGPLSSSPALFLFALVPGRDGIRAELDGKRAWLTVDDMLVSQVYDRGVFFEGAGLGTDRKTVLALLAAQLGATPADVARRATLTRVRMERTRVDGAAPPEPVTAGALTPERVTAAVRDAARYLARHVGPNGRFDYVVFAPTGTPLDAGYNWPRHAGATTFLAQAAALLDDPSLRGAALRAAACLRDTAMTDCGDARCVAFETDEADVGSSALALLAFAEIVRTGADRGDRADPKSPSPFRPAISELAGFLRSQQRPDGELMHLYKRSERRPIDVQYLYYTGEAALALSRAHRVTGDPRDLDAAKRALARVSGDAWSFFGSRYFYGEEHWTCQAVADLWDRAPNERALDFCLRWLGYQRALQYRDGDSPFVGADGAFGFGPIVTPRLTPASSRGEAAGAALDVVEQRSDLAPAGEARALDDELSRAVAFVLRGQFSPGPSWLFATPEAVRGAVPGSPVDWQLRIDYEQHAGSMLIRWLDRAKRPKRQD